MTHARKKRERRKGKKMYLREYLKTMSAIKSKYFSIKRQLLCVNNNAV